MEGIHGYKSLKRVKRNYCNLSKFTWKIM